MTFFFVYSFSTGYMLFLKGLFSLLVFLQARPLDCHSQALELGQRLRKRYMEQLGFLNPAFQVYHKTL